MEYRIEVLDTDERFCCREDEYVLAAMRRAGCGPIRYGCFGGGCGICKMKVAKGEYAIVKKMSRAHVSEGEQAEGVALICCIQPRSDLILVRTEALKKRKDD